MSRVDCGNCPFTAGCEEGKCGKGHAMCYRRPATYPPLPQHATMSSIADITYYLEPYLPQPTPLAALDALVTELNTKFPEELALSRLPALVIAEAVLAREEAEPKPTRGQPTLREIAAMLPSTPPPPAEAEIRRDTRDRIADWLTFEGHPALGNKIRSRDWP